ncbi:hypothetical protein H5410_034375 [Solanum commersonii]|uniref:Uncharacterized protein n=1 Tax=Solanum commersonii TaxID=4109 RepID=A0A9J5YT39_SOLCO|nr:hypothetical protein H5410_034375 [Solanum commersonii]
MAPRFPEKLCVDGEGGPTKPWKSSLHYVFDTGARFNQIHQQSWKDIAIILIIHSCLISDKLVSDDIYDTAFLIMNEMTNKLEATKFVSETICWLTM